MRCRKTDGSPAVSSLQTVLIYRFDELWRNDMPCDGPGSANVTAGIALGEKKIRPANEDHAEESTTVIAGRRDPRRLPRLVYGRALMSLTLSRARAVLQHSRRRGYSLHQKQTKLLPWPYCAHLP